MICWVYTRDLEGTCDFYSNTLGLTLDRDEGSARIYVVNAGARIGICLAFADRVVQPDGGMISIVTDDVDGWYAKLIAGGIEIAQPPHTLEQFGIYTFFAHDPKGYIIEFQQFID